MKRVQEGDRTDTVRSTSSGSFERTLTSSTKSRKRYEGSSRALRRITVLGKNPGTAPPAAVLCHRVLFTVLRLNVHKKKNSA
eukprot:gene4182-3021_t